MVCKVCENGLTGPVCKGVVKNPIFDAIPIDRWLPPALHIMMGLENQLIDAVFNYIDNRHEFISPEEATAREAYWKEIIKYEDLQQELLERGMENEDDVNETKELIKELERKKKEKNPEGSIERKKRAAKYSNAETKVMTEEINRYKEFIKQVEDEKKIGRDELVDADKMVKLKLSLYLAIKKRRGKADSPLSNQVDLCLRDYGIDRAAFHGGALLGVQCLMMGQHIEPLFNDIKDVLISNLDSDVPESEVHEMFESFKIHLLMTDHAISLVHSDRRAGFLHSQISQNSPINPPEISFSTQITQ